jgi:hypothetical protein
VCRTTPVFFPPPQKFFLNHFTYLPPLSKKVGTKSRRRRHTTQRPTKGDIMQRSTRYLLAINAMLFKEDSETLARLIRKAARLVESDEQRRILDRQSRSYSELLRWQEKN